MLNGQGGRRRSPSRGAILGTRDHANTIKLGTQAAMPNAVSLRSVSKRFGRHVAVDRLTLTVPAGSLYGFIGPNGSGKTTTLRMILRIILPDEGEVEVLGAKEGAAASDRVGYLPEERGLYKKMSVRRILAYYAALKGLTGRAARREIDAWLERFELAAWAGRTVEALSKGMAQKVQFIASVVARPELVILDEPFSGLDPVNLEVVRQAILDLRAGGTTVIFSTHDMHMAEQMCDFVCMIFRGQKVLDGTLESIKAAYGADTIRLRLEGGRQCLEGLPGIERLRDLGTMQEVQYAGDTQELLAALTARTRVQQFEVAHPSLHDIFIRIAGPEAENGRA
jgi:ABC-2 type transport system ATP-binding protein